MAATVTVQVGIKPSACRGVTVTANPGAESGCESESTQTGLTVVIMRAPKHALGIKTLFYPLRFLFLDGFGRKFGACQPGPQGPRIRRHHRAAAHCSLQPLRCRDGQTRRSDSEVRLGGQALEDPGEGTRSGNSEVSESR